MRRRFRVRVVRCRFEYVDVDVTASLTDPDDIIEKVMDEVECYPDSKWKTLERQFKDGEGHLPPLRLPKGALGEIAYGLVDTEEMQVGILEDGDSPSTYITGEELLGMLPEAERERRRSMAAELARKRAAEWLKHLTQQPLPIGLGSAEALALLEARRSTKQ